MSDPKRSKRRSDGFLERGHNVTRLEAFVDASFAFAVTLLVISLDGMPGSIDDLLDALKKIPAFAVSFALLTYFWFAHHTWSRRYGLDNRASILLSLLLVFLVLVWVYPLRVLFGTAFGWFTHLALPLGWQIPFTFKIDGIGDLKVMYLVYGLAWSSLGIVVAFLYRQGWKRRVELDLSFEERLATRAEIARWLWVPVTGGISIGSAYLLSPGVPDWLAGVPGMSYASMALTDVVVKISARRWKPRIEAEMKGGS